MAWGNMICMCSPIFRMAVCTFPRDNRSPGLNKLSTCYYCVQFFSFFQNCINFFRNLCFRNSGMSGRKVKLLLVHCFPLLASLKSQTLLVQGTPHYFYCLDSRVDILFCLNFSLLWRLKAACRIRFCLSRLCTACRGRVWLTILLDSGKMWEL